MHQNFLQQDLIGIIMAQGHHSKTVANKYNVYSSRVDGEGGREVVGGDHGDGLVLLVHGAQGTDGHFFSGRRGTSPI